MSKSLRRNLSCVIHCLLLIGIVGSTGCTWTSRRWSAWKVTDPPSLSPDAQPLHSESPPATALPDVVPPDEDGPSITIRQRLDAPPLSPELPPQSTPSTATPSPPARPVMRVDSSDTAVVGETVPFQISIAFPEGRPLRDVVIESELPSGMRFPGSRELRIRQPLGDVDGGTTRRLSLALQAAAPGTHCVTFTVQSEGDLLSTERRCLEVKPAPLDVVLHGPSRRQLGDRAEYLIAIRNRSGKDITGALVRARFDPSLVAREASAGVRRDSRELSWRLGTILKDERIHIQVEFECGPPSGMACLNVILESEGHQDDIADACLAIVEPAGVQLSLSDKTDPVAVGDQVTYRLTMEIPDGEPTSGRRELRLSIPPQLRYGELNAILNKVATTVVARPDRSGVRVELPSMTAGDRLELTVNATALSAGTATVAAQVYSDEMPVGPRLDEPTIIQP